MPSSPLSRAERGVYDGYRSLGFGYLYAVCGLPRIIHRLASHTRWLDIVARADKKIYARYGGE